MGAGNSVGQSKLSLFLIYHYCTVLVFLRHDFSASSFYVSKFYLLHNTTTVAVKGPSLKRTKEKEKKTKIDVSQNLLFFGIYRHFFLFVDITPPPFLPHLQRRWEREDQHA